LPDLGGHEPIGFADIQQFSAEAAEKKEHTWLLGTMEL
jgi:hypothetical protein